MNKAFFINGGAGRVICSIPGLERYAKTGKDFTIVSEGWTEIFLENKILEDKVFHINHKNLFKDHLRDKEIITPEPYRLNDYFNQRCNLVQAFDMLINDLTEIPPSSRINLTLTQREIDKGNSYFTHYRDRVKKIIVFQPFGSTAKVQGSDIFDFTGRSFTHPDTVNVIHNLKKNNLVVIMAPFSLLSVADTNVFQPMNLSLRDWMGIINAADMFLGCDSVGQHIAYGLGKPAVVVTGSTFPENISYPKEESFKIIDNGKKTRLYSPIRITNEQAIDMHNKDCMVLSKKSFSEILSACK